MSVGNIEDQAVKDDGNDDGQNDCHPDFHIWPDSVAPFLFLKQVEVNNKFLQLEMDFEKPVQQTW